MVKTKHKLFKFLSIFLILCFIFEQSAFAQVVGQLDISGYLAGLRNTLSQDKFRPLHLRYLRYDTRNNNFSLLLDKGDLKDMKSLKLEETTQKLLEYFFVGVSLPNDSFWVNLRPGSPDNIIDPYLAQTDVGKILLEADIQLKKDTAKFTSPENPKGKEYWDKLYQKAGELFGYNNITIPTLTRPWIVPDEIIVREADDNAYIYKATLKVQIEQDNLQGAAVYNFNDPRLKELNEYSSQLIRELIIPELTKEVNISKRYAPLRQVYYSLIIAQWFKQKFFNKGGFYSTLIDKRNLNGIISKKNWSKATYFKEYQKSFQKGEYNIQQPISTSCHTIRSYFSGGVDFGVNQGQGGVLAAAIQRGLVQASTPGDVLAGNSHALPVNVTKGGTADNVGVDIKAIKLAQISGFQFGYSGNEADGVIIKARKVIEGGNIATTFTKVKKASRLLQTGMNGLQLKQSLRYRAPAAVKASSAVKAFKREDGGFVQFISSTEVGKRSFSMGMGSVSISPEGAPTLTETLDYLEQSPNDRLMILYLYKLVDKLGQKAIDEIIRRFKEKPSSILLGVLVSIKHGQYTGVDEVFQAVIKQIGMPRILELWKAHPLIDVRRKTNHQSELSKGAEYLEGIFRMNRDRQVPLNQIVIRRLPFPRDLVDKAIHRRYMHISSLEANQLTPDVATGTSLREITAEETITRIDNLPLSDVLDEQFTGFGFNKTYSIGVGWKLYLKVANGRNHTIIKGHMVSSGKGLTKEAATASGFMEMIERYSSVAGAFDDFPSGYVQDKTMLLSKRSELITKGLNVLDINSLNLKFPYKDEQLYWVWGEQKTFEGARPILVPAQLVFIETNFDEPEISFYGQSSNGLASGNVPEEARLHALLEIIERDGDYTVFYSPERCFTVDIKEDEHPIGQIIAVAGQRGIAIQFLDLTTEFGVPAYRAFVRIGNQVISGSGAHLDARIALTRALCELQPKLFVYFHANGGLKGISNKLVSNKVIKYAELPNYSTGNVKGDLILTEKLLLENGYTPTYIDLTRKELGIPVVRAIIPGLDMPDGISERQILHLMQELKQLGMSVDLKFYNATATRGPADKDNPPTEDTPLIEKDGNLPQNNPGSSSSGQVTDDGGKEKSDSQASSTVGGVDFRAMPIINQPLNTPNISMPLGRLDIFQADPEWKEIQNMVNTGIIPSGQRIKNFLQTACCRKKELNGEIAVVLNCIADILRIEEECISATNPEFKEMLILLESGSSKSGDELNRELSKINFQLEELKRGP